MNQEARKDTNQYQGPRKRGRHPGFKFEEVKESKIKDHPDISEHKFKPKENASIDYSGLDKRLENIINMHRHCLSRINFLYGLSYVTWLALALRLLYLSN